MSIKSGYKPKEEQKPVESIKIETGTRRGTVKYTVNGKTVDNVLIKPIPQTTGVRKEDLDGEYAPKNHKHKEYLKPEEVNIHGEGQDGELLLHEETQDVQNNGTFTLEMKKDEQYERIVTLPFTGLQHLAFADQLNYYNDVYDQQDPTLLLHQAELSAQFKTDMEAELNQNLEFVSTTRNSTITGGNLTISHITDPDTQQDIGGNLSCDNINCLDVLAWGDVTVRGHTQLKDNLYVAEVDFTQTPPAVNTRYQLWCGYLDCMSVDAGDISCDDISTSGNINCNNKISLYASNGNIDCYGVYCTKVESIGDVDSTNGNMHANNFIQNSDKRLKNVVDTINIPVEDLANAPLVQFKWNEKKQTKDTSTHGGTLAQYWQQIAPWAVGKDKEKYLTLEYGPLALAAAVECAREIVKLKERIKELEERQ